MKYLTYLDLNANEIRNANVQNLASAPSSPSAGRIYYDTTLGTARVYNGTAWIAVDASKLSGLIPMSALTFDPSNRANQSGTQLASTISNFTAAVTAISLDQLTPPAANVAFNAKNITGLADPVNPQDGATKNYVDNNIQAAAAGIQSKPPVAVVATSNQTLSGLPTVDGVTLTAGQRILLTAQTTTTQNGPYIVSSGAWARPSGDASPNNELTLGALWYVEQGTTYGGSQWIISSPTSGTITPGTTSVTIVQFTAASALTFSTGVQKVGNAVSAQVVAAGGVLAAAGGLSVDTTVVARKFSATIGDGSTTAIVVTHNLGTLDVIVQVYDSPSAGANFTQPEISRTTTNTVTLTFTTAPAASSIRVTILG